MVSEAPRAIKVQWEAIVLKSVLMLVAGSFVGILVLLIGVLSPFAAMLAPKAEIAPDRPLPRGRIDDLPQGTKHETVK